MVTRFSTVNRTRLKSHSETKRSQLHNRLVQADVVSIDNIVEKSSLPAIMPWNLHQGDARWRREHPARVGRSDTLTLQTMGGEEAQTEILRNGKSEFHALGNQGAHDVDHIYFEAAWEALGGQPILSASPLNEMLVNAFEWVMTPMWRDNRIDEINTIRQKQGKAPVGGIPSDQEFVHFQLESAGLDGARQVVHQTAARSAPVNNLFEALGRDIADFPNRTELDVILRLVNGSSQSLDQVLMNLKEFSLTGLALAREVSGEMPELGQEVNTVRDKVLEVCGSQSGSAIVSSRKLSFRPEFVERVQPLVKKMNKVLGKLPPAYRHGLRGVVEDTPPVMPFLLAP